MRNYPINRKTTIASDELLAARLSRPRTMNELRKISGRYRKGKPNSNLRMLFSLKRLIIAGKRQRAEGWLINRLFLNEPANRPTAWKQLILDYYSRGGSPQKLEKTVDSASSALKYSGQFVTDRTLLKPTIESANFRHSLLGGITMAMGSLARLEFEASRLSEESRKPK